MISESNDRFNLKRFTDARTEEYKNVLTQLRHGQKRTCWMWFIFPQIEGMGSSPNAIKYAIKSLEEARQFLDHPVLGPRLLECAEMVMTVKGRTALQILGSPDDMKLQSSMTLFSYVAGPGAVFDRVLDKYFNGERDIRTLQLLKEE